MFPLGTKNWGVSEENEVHIVYYQYLFFVRRIEKDMGLDFKERYFYYLD